MNRRQMVGAVVAMAAAGLVLANTVKADDPAPTKAPKTVKCAGGNACKGQGACNGGGHSCSGNNDCKGKGWIMTATEKECTDAGGKVVPPKGKKKGPATDEKKS